MKWLAGRQEKSLHVYTVHRTLYRTICVTFMCKCVRCTPISSILNNTTLFITLLIQMHIRRILNYMYMENMGNFRCEYKLYSLVALVMMMLTISIEIVGKSSEKAKSMPNEQTEAFNNKIYELNWTYWSKYDVRLSWWNLMNFHITNCRCIIIITTTTTVFYTKKKRKKE